MKVVVVNDELHLEIRDNGQGPSADWQQSGHFGVIGMSERAQGLGGHLLFEPLQPQGARVLAVLPLRHNSDHG